MVIKVCHQCYITPRRFKSCHWNRFVLGTGRELLATNDDSLGHNRRGCAFPRWLLE